MVTEVLGILLALPGPLCTGLWEVTQNTACVFKLAEETVCQEAGIAASLTGAGIVLEMTQDAAQVEGWDGRITQGSEDHQLPGRQGLKICNAQIVHFLMLTPVCTRPCQCLCPRKELLFGWLVALS